LEAGLKPDLLVGTSIGACNAAYLALRGVSPQGISDLEGVWRDAMRADLLQPNYFMVTMASVLRRRINTNAEGRLRQFWLAHGIQPDMRFGQVEGVRLILVSADLNTGKPQLFGTSPDDSIFEGMQASTALPPWIRPIRRDGHMLIDGGFLSSVPIEAAVDQGATEVIALDVTDKLPDHVTTASGLRPGMQKLSWSVQQRQIQLEERVAVAYGVSVQRIVLRTTPAVPVWDFSRTKELILAGYETTRLALLNRQQPSARTRLWTARDWFVRSRERMALRRKTA
jgi:NTE family protein